MRILSLETSKNNISTLKVQNYYKTREISFQKLKEKKNYIYKEKHTWLKGQGLIGYN